MDHNPNTDNFNVGTYIDRYVNKIKINNVFM